MAPAPRQGARTRAPRVPAAPLAPAPEPAAAPAAGTLDELRAAAHDCRACPLWADATQTVFGEGPERARIMLVGEQPGDQEDRQGHPFVGPAGRLLDRALEDAGIPRAAVYLTNAVKHFKWEPRGKRRLHKKPVDAEIAASHPWLERELAFVAPDLVVAMGATAARSLLGRTTPIGANRGRLLPFGGGQLLITVHPSYLLRVPEEAKTAEYGRFVRDLALALPFVTAAPRRR